MSSIDFVSSTEVKTAFLFLDIYEHFISVGNLWFFKVFFFLLNCHPEYLLPHLVNFIHSQHLSGLRRPRLPNLH